MNNTDFREKLAEQGMEIPYSTDTDIYSVPLVLYGKKIPNRIGIQPLEGFDSCSDGSPSGHVYRRYLRFVSGGAGLVWFEACAVSEDGKSNPNQMMITEDNVGAFRSLIAEMDRKAAEEGREPCFKILQLTHSGRTSQNNNWEKIPLSPKKLGEDDPAEIASDEKISQMVQDHIRSAVLAAEAGFDAVDVKACHGYFMSELLSAYNREGRYGGSFENRTRAILEMVDGIKAQVGDRIGICARLNAFDAEAYPNGFGVVEENGKKRADTTEIIRLCRLLKDRGVELIDISGTAPAERIFGPEPSDPRFKRYAGSCDLLAAVKQIREAVDGVAFMCTGLTSFGAQGGYIGAGGIKDGWFDIAGFGRQALAYPGFAKDLLERGRLDENKCCTDCGSCFRLMDPGHSRTGCVVRDADEFLPLYRKYVLK